MATQDKTGFMSYAGSAIATVVGAMTVQEWAAVMGIVLAVGTFAVNLHYKRKLSDAQLKADKAKADYYSGAGDGDSQN